MLANEEITLQVDGEVVHLRPTLRAAARLERRHRGFANIVKAISEGNLSVMADVVSECSDRYSTIPEFLRAFESLPLRKGIEIVSTPVLAIVLKMAGVDQDQSKTDKPATGDRISFSEYHERLFGIGTGVLGWSPETTWNATPAEILAGYKARLDLLTAMFGAKQPDTGKREHTPDEVRQGIAQLRALSLRGANIGVGLCP